MGPHYVISSQLPVYIQLLQNKLLKKACLNITRTYCNMISYGLLILCPSKIMAFSYFLNVALYYFENALNLLKISLTYFLMA